MKLLMTRGAVALIAALALAMPGGIAVAGETALSATASARDTFASPEEGVTALIDAAKGNNLAALAAMLGPGSEKLINSGDKVADNAQRQKFVAAYDEYHQLISAGQGRMTLQVGKNHWPLPIPLTEADGRWHFDSRAGAQELVDRRIGRNEIAAIRTALAYVDAQKTFHALTGARGKAQYARRFLSAPGKHDGLYWPAAEGQPQSPLEPLVAQARAEGYPVNYKSHGPHPYFGYYFHILTGQGSSSPEGASNYISNGRMTRGFALVAWPTVYGASGIMTFIVNQDGIVFQKDLGRRTATVASAMKLFNPDLTWVRVEVVD